MKKLSQLLKESQDLDYRRMNVGEEEGQGMTKEEKRAFVEAVAAYRQLGEMISHKGNISEIHDSIKGIVENANNLTLKETGDWFDRVTVQRHMKSMNESFKVFSNTIKEVSTLQQRLESSYDEIGEVLGKYYEIKEGNEFGAERAKAIAAGEDSFEVDGKSYKVSGVDAEDKKNAEEFANESMKLTSLIKRNEELTGKQKELDVDSDGDIEADDLADLRAGKKADESVNEIKKGSIVMPYAMDKYGEFIVDKVFKNKSGETSYTGKFKKSGESREFILHSKDKVVKESVNEGVSPADMDKIKGAVESASSFMSVGGELKKLGMKYTFATEPLPIYIIQPTPNNKVAIVNKKYATKPDFVVGDIAVGIMEGKLNEEEIKWDAVQNAIINFLKMNTKILDKRVQAKDTNGVKGGLKSIISGLVNAQRNLKLESVNEGVRISLFDPNKNKILKSLSVDRNYKEAEKEVETLNKRLSASEKNKGYYWKITTIGESVNEASYVSGYTVKAKTPYEFVNGAYAVLSAYLRDEELGPKGKRELQDIIKSLEYMRKYFFFKLSESVNEGKFKVDDLVYNKRTKTVGIVRMGDDKYGEVKTDADGNVDVDELEIYNPIKNKQHQNAKAAPSTVKEVDKRGLFNPFKMEVVNELKKLPSGNFSIKVGYPTFADYEKKAKTGDTILRYDKRGGMIKTFVNGSELDKNAEKYLDKVNGIIGGVVFLTKKGMKGVAQVPDYEKKDIGVLVLESKSVNEEKYTVIDPMGNQKGVGPKIQAISMAKRLGGEKTGHFVVANTNALKARRALEKFKGDFKNP
jgi:hypothetical protein